MAGGSARGASTVVGVLLLVGVVVIVGGVVALGALTFLDGTGAPQATATFDYEETPVGLRMTPGAISTTVTVQLNGRDVATFEPDSAGQSVLLPTAPGDRITVVSRDRDRSVLVDRTVEGRSEVGDFIAYYRFDGQDGDTTLVDRPGNDNNATFRGDTPDSWTDSSYEFDGSDDFFEVENLNTPVSNVSEFTIAVAYETNTGAQKQELVEHISGSDNWGAELKPCNTGCSNSEYEPVFFVDRAGGSQTGQIFATKRTENKRHVLVGTYDRSAGETTVYIDGESEATGSFDSEINMGEFYIGRDAEGTSDYLDGEIYEIRLYYTSFDGEEVEVITNAME
jgi:hypothetical protein